jgi:hypothetical protein
VLSFRSFIDALFLGSGAYANPSDRGCFGSRMAGWRDGTQVRVRVAASLPSQVLTVAHATSVQAFEATGVISAFAETTTQDPLVANDNEIIVVEGTGCPAGAVGCAGPLRVTGSFFLAGRVTLVPPVQGAGATAHEVGHALYGFCHVLNVVSGEVTPWSRLTIMGFGGSGGQLTPSDVKALQAVYRASLRAGATRSDFIAAGLIDP